MGWRMKAGAQRGSIHGAPARVLLITGGRDGEGGHRRMQGAPRRRQYRKEGRGQCRRWGGGRAAGGVAAGEVRSVKNTKGTDD